MAFVTLDEAKDRTARRRALLHLALCCAVLLALVALATLVPVADAAVEGRP